jgi:hypothetical protein
MKNVGWLNASERRVSLSRSSDPFELRASPEDLAGLRTGLSSYAVVSKYGWTDQVWLRIHERLWVISVAQRVIQFKFEVFTLGFETQDDFEKRKRAAAMNRLADASAVLQGADSWRSVTSPPPSEFRSWPLETFNVHVLRRAEFQIGYLDPPPVTIGNNPIAQDVVKPGHVPPDAWASCEVAAGLLFAGCSRERLLIGVDWAADNMLVTQDAAVIDEYIASCEAVGLADYIRRIEQTKE